MPGIECIETSLDIDIINQHAAVCAPVERYAKALEPLLPCRAPYLHQSNTQRFLLSVVHWCNVKEPKFAQDEDHLQGDKLIFNEHLLGEEISSDRRLVLLAKLLVHISNRCQANQSTSKLEHLEDTRRSPILSPVCHTAQDLFPIHE